MIDVMMSAFHNKLECQFRNMFGWGGGHTAKGDLILKMDNTLGMKTKNMLLQTLMTYYKLR